MSEAAVRVLLVEDEVLIRDTLQLALEDGGFSVRTVSSGEEAVALLGAGRSGVRALVTDVKVAPGGITGWQVEAAPFSWSVDGLG